MTVKFDQDALGTRLKAEGQAETPAYSPLLHERVMGALRTRGRAPLEEGRGGWGWGLLRIGIGVAVAASIAVAAWVVLNPRTPAEEAAPAVVQIPLASQPSLGNPVQELVGGAKKLEEGKFGFLDRDAQRLAVFVADQLPTFGTGPGERK